RLPARAAAPQARGRPPRPLRRSVSRRGHPPVMRYAVARGRRTRRHRGGTAALGAAATAGLRSAGHEVTEVVTDSLEQARRRCGALLADGVDVLAVAGGDGAVSLGADLCAGTGTALAILPSGTGNDTARSLG